jgi:hypothetical protein
MSVSPGCALGPKGLSSGTGTTLHFDDDAKGGILLNFKGTTYTIAIGPEDGPAAASVTSAAAVVADAATLATNVVNDAAKDAAAAKVVTDAAKVVTDAADVAAAKVVSDAASAATALAAAALTAKTVTDAAAAKAVTDAASAATAVATAASKVVTEAAAKIVSDAALAAKTVTDAAAAKAATDAASAAAAVATAAAKAVTDAAAAAKAVTDAAATAANAVISKRSTKVVADNVYDNVNVSTDATTDMTGPIGGNRIGDPNLYDPTDPTNSISTLPSAILTDASKTWIFKANGGFGYASSNPSKTWSSVDAGPKITVGVKLTNYELYDITKKPLACASGRITHGEENNYVWSFTATVERVAGFDGVYVGRAVLYLKNKRTDPTKSVATTNVVDAVWSPEVGQVSYGVVPFHFFCHASLDGGDGEITKVCFNKLNYTVTMK